PPRHPGPAVFPYATLFRSRCGPRAAGGVVKFRILPRRGHAENPDGPGPAEGVSPSEVPYPEHLERRAHPRSPLHFRRIELKYFLDRKSTRLNSSHVSISYA